VLTKVPEVPKKLAEQICSLMQRIREMDFLKKPGIAETLDWAEALVTLNKELIDKETLEETLGCIFKYREDMDTFREAFKEEGFFAALPCG
jgi:MoxR-like ATPase